MPSIFRPLIFFITGISPAASFQFIPTLFIPVSIFIFTCRSPSSFSAVREKSSADDKEFMVRISLFFTASATEWGEHSPRTYMGAPIPAFLSFIPSSTSATPRAAAPLFNTCFETSTAPCPYPSALTTAIT